MARPRPIPWLLMVVGALLPSGPACQTAGLAPGVAPAASRNPHRGVAPDRRRAITARLRPVVEIRGRARVRHRLADRLRYYRVPGLSVAVVDEGRLSWTHVEGVTERGGGRHVRPDTPFQAASISKVMAATAALQLVGEGRLALDVDVNRYLRSWRVPESPFTARVKVTLRRILSHSSGLTGHSVREYPVEGPLPTLPQVLEGQPPSRTPAVRVDQVPGSGSRYSGAGFTVVQLLLIEATAMPFATLLRSRIFEPLGMKDSTFEQPPPPALRARAAIAHDSAGKRVADSVYADLAAAGLWTTPRDLLVWAMEVAAAREGRSSRLLPVAMAAQMLTPQTPPFGLGLLLRGAGANLHFGHPGWNEGFHSELVYYPARRQGAAVMVNGDGGRPLIREILQSIAEEYGWPGPEPTRIDELPRELPVLERLVGTYRSAPPIEVSVTLDCVGGRLWLETSRLGGRTELVFTATDRLVAVDTGDPFSMIADADGTVKALKLGFLMLERQPQGADRLQGCRPSP